MWAFWRRLQYGSAFGLFCILILSSVYFNYVYSAPTCFDGKQNGTELGIDCNGGCKRICAFSVIAPKVDWVRSFRVQDGQYNAVAYIENKNKVAASPRLTYTISLHDVQGLIAERKGETILPPDSVYPVFEAQIDTGTRIPTQTFITLDEVALWQPATAGSNQFRVTDRKLTREESKPRLDATIFNDALVKAKRVEVIATLFDAQGTALNASRTFIDNFEARSSADVIFTWPEPIAQTLRNCSVPTDIVLAIDLSGSMNSDSIQPPQPLTSVLSAAKSFVDRLQPTDKVGLVTFATTAMIHVPLTKTISSVSQQISKLAISPKEETGSTNTGDAFTKSVTALVSPASTPGSRKVMVLLTDGLATAPATNSAAFAQSEAKKAKDAGITVYTIGLGASVNMDFVKSLASSPSESYQAVTTQDVDTIYKNITNSLCAEGAAVIEIIPKSDASFEGLE